MKLGALVERLAARLEASGAAFGHGTSNAFDEAAWLVRWRLKLPLDAYDDTTIALRLTPAEVQAAEALVDERIATRRPAAYLTGEAWLQGVAFDADARAIVPRSLIAEPLADGTLDAFLPDAEGRVLDLCTGGGSLAVLAALAWPQVQVDAADVSPEALALARQNIVRHGLQARIAAIESDAFASLAGRRYDLVLCNPPYVNAASMAALPAEYRAEPALALAGGTDGMDFVRRLLRDLPAFLNPGAALVLEIGHERPHFERAFPRLEAIWLDTSAGADAVLVLTREALAAGHGAQGSTR